MRKWLLILLVTGCPAKGTTSGVGTGTATASGTAAVPPPLVIDAGAFALAPAPPPPPVPLGLPATDDTPVLHADAIALGELLFFDPRLSASGTTSCASCHDPDHGWSDLRPRAATDGGSPNLRRTPPIANLLWQARSGGFAWDGRYATLADLIGAHWKGQLGLSAADAIAKIGDNPTYHAHLTRQPAAPTAADAAVLAIADFVMSRYQGDSPWDRYEHGDKSAVSAQAVAGYLIFTGKAQCSVCHVPPLYTDGAFHALGLIALADEGRGRVDPRARGAFRTPTLRGAALHAPYFHDGSAPTLEAAIDWHLAGGVGQGADRSIIDPALGAVALTPDARADLIAFVRALSPPTASYKRPETP